MKLEKILTMALVFIALLLLTSTKSIAQPDGLLFWNTMDSQEAVGNSEVGPSIIQTTYKFPLWGEAQIVEAKFGNGLFINHDTNEGWKKDGGNFFIIDNEAAGMSPERGTIEFWWRFMYDCTTHNHALIFAMNDELTGHYATWPPVISGTYFNLTWNGWNYGSFGKRYSIGGGNSVDGISFYRNSADFSTFPGGALEFYKDELSHFAVVWDVEGIDGSNETMRLYIDGKIAISLQNTWTTSGGIAKYTYLGSTPNHSQYDHYYNAFKGVHDNVKIFDHAKTNFDDRFFEGIITCPEELVVECDANLTPEELGYPEVIVNCVGDVTYSYIDDIVPGVCGDDYLIERNWTISDPCGSIGYCTQFIKVVDAQAPVISLVSEPTILWPPNHKYYSVQLSDIVLDADDNCRSIPIDEIVVKEVTSDEPENGDDDGNTVNDIVINPGCQSVNLRAERQGDGNGRVYTITLSVLDDCGNEGIARYKVLVPPSKKKSALDDGANYTIFGCNTSTARISDNSENMFDLDKKFRFTIYPNPTNDLIYIEDTHECFKADEDLEIIFYSLEGIRITQKIHSIVNFNRLEIDVSYLPAGMYIMSIPEYRNLRHKLLKL